MKLIFCALLALLVTVKVQQPPLCLTQQAEARAFLESDKPHHLPTGWKEVGLAEDDDLVTLTFVLHVRQPQLLEYVSNTLGVLAIYLQPIH